MNNISKFNLLPVSLVSCIISEFLILYAHMIFAMRAVMYFFDSLHRTYEDTKMV